MERTGHRSVEGVISYKRTSKALSDILNTTTKEDTTVAIAGPQLHVPSLADSQQQLATHPVSTVNKHYD